MVPSTQGTLFQFWLQRVCHGPEEGRRLHAAWRKMVTESGVLLGLMHVWPPAHMIPSRLGAPRSSSRERFPSDAWAPPHPRRSVLVCAVERAMRRGLALPLGGWSAHRGMQWGLPTMNGGGGEGRTPKQGLRNCS